MSTAIYKVDRPPEAPTFWHMTSPIETALQIILAADYGLNEGDHLKLCDLLKHSFDASKKTGLIETSRTTSPLNIKIEFHDPNGTTYCLQTHTAIHYVQNGTAGANGYVPSLHITRGTCTRIGKPMLDLEWRDKTPSMAIATIIDLHETSESFAVSRDSMTRIISYRTFINHCVKKDVLEQKARKKFGPLPDDMEEHDGHWWRGDYGYPRFKRWIAEDLLT
jgi:hypothetical protein